MHTYPDNVLVDHNKADKHGHVGQHGEDGQDLEVLDEREQHHERQEGKHVQPGVHGGVITTVLFELQSLVVPFAADTTWGSTESPGEPHHTGLKATDLSSPSQVG